MPEKIVIRSDNDSYTLFSLTKNYFVGLVGERPYFNHSHNMIEISYTLTGSGQVMSGGVKYDFHPGSLIIHYSNEQHYVCHINEGEDTSFLVLHFDPGFIWSMSSEWSCRQYYMLFSRENNLGRTIPADAEAPHIISGLLNEMFTECLEHAPAYEIIVKSKLMMILAVLVRHYSTELDTMSGSSYNCQHIEVVEKTVKYILGHLCEDITVEDIAREACMSRTYFCSVFKNIYGISVWDYVIGQRIDLARYKLETTEEPITRIIYESGFGSVGNFSHAFKKITGLSPREYRQNHQNS